MKGAGGGLFQLDLSLAKSGNCSSSITTAVNIVNNITAIGVTSMTLNLEDSLLYFAIGKSDLLSFSLEGGEIVNYTHETSGLNSESIASYNRYLAVTVDGPLISFVSIRIGGALEILPAGNFINRLYMIREEFQPLPGISVWLLSRVYKSIYIYIYHEPR